MLRRREREGWRRLGRKIGFTNREMMIRYGVDSPIFGYVYDRTLTYARDGVAVLALDRLVQPLIEPEIVFKLRHSPPATDDPRALLEVGRMAGAGVRARAMPLSRLDPRRG